MKTYLIRACSDSNKALKDIELLYRASNERRAISMVKNKLWKQLEYNRIEIIGRQVEPIPFMIGKVNGQLELF